MIGKIILLGFLIGTMMHGFMLGETNAKTSSEFYLYIGAYTQNENEGIYVYKFDATKGDLKYVATVKGIENPSYLAIDAKRNILVAVNEVEEYKGEKAGAVTSFSINPLNGQLEQINQVSSKGGSPCYVSINKSGEYAFVANYSGGNIAVLPISSTGELVSYSDLKQHAGTGPITDRQEKAHAHSIILDPKEHFALGIDLGIDKVITYAIDERSGTLTMANEFNSAPGSGPRHLAFHPNKKLAYIINELNSTITSCAYNLKDGRLTKLNTLSTLPSDFRGDNSCADIHVSPDGKFLYGSNRGHDSIVIYKIEQNSGKLEYVEHHSVNGKTPRNFMIDPTGKFLLVANQNTNNIVVFKIDQESGRLKSNGVEVEVSKPVCLKMIAAD